MSIDMVYSKTRLIESLLIFRYIMDILTLNSECLKNGFRT